MPKFADKAHYLQSKFYNIEGSSERVDFVTGLSYIIIRETS